MGRSLRYHCIPHVYVPAASLTATAGSQPNIGIGSLIDGTRYYTSSLLIPHLTLRALSRGTV